MNRYLLDATVFVQAKSLFGKITGAKKAVGIVA